MTTKEFSNEFDVLYSNITSNQALGLDEYEKTVFLTKALDEIIKAYFDPKSNKVQEGFDSSERRLIDFSMLLKSVSFEDEATIESLNVPFNNSLMVVPAIPQSWEALKSAVASGTAYLESQMPSIALAVKVTSYSRPPGYNPTTMTPSYYVFKKSITTSSSVFGDPIFDDRDTTKSITLPLDVLMFVNEYVIVKRGEKEEKVRLAVIPINYREYSRLMSKPYKRPLKYQAWRLIDNSAGNKKAELVVGPKDILTKYVVRYVKRPNPIILADLVDEGVTINGKSEVTECELDPILHPEILARAVELAKAAYSGDLQSSIALGTNSGTPMGMITQSR